MTAAMGTDNDYGYHIVYRKSADHANTDALSRLPIGSDPNFENTRV